jgi:uncharacterized protein YbjT (DUF2867 family)
VRSYFSPVDIAECAAIILTQPIEKHDRLIYEMGAEMVSNEQRAAIFSKVLGKTIIYEQVSAADFYKIFIGAGLAHSLAYDFVSYGINDGGQVATPQLSILLGKEPRTLEAWIKDNAKAFQ